MRSSQVFLVALYIGGFFAGKNMNCKVHTYVSLCVCMHMCTRMSISLYVCVSMHVHACMCVHMCAHVCVSACMCVCQQHHPEVGVLGLNSATSGHSPPLVPPDVQGSLNLDK